jgi:hypothetical protein
VIESDDLSLFERSLPLAYTLSVRDIAAPGIQALRWTICLKETNSNACLCGTRSYQLLCRIHQARGDPLSLELREDPEMMDQRNVLLTKLRIIRLPADSEIASQTTLNPGKERIGFPFSMIAEMLVCLFGISWIDLLDKELDELGKVCRSNPLYMDVVHNLSFLSLHIRSLPPFDPVRCSCDLMHNLRIVHSLKRRG